MNRSDIIDLVRGIAVLIMIFANSSPYFIVLDNQYTLRFVFSIAAPIFLIITGYCSQSSYINSTQVFKRHLLRIFQIFIIGSFIDAVFWRSVPIVTFDILYLIAISQLVLLFINKLGPKALILFILLIFVGNYLAHNTWIYRFENPDFNFQTVKFKLLFKADVFQRMLFDGWFPILPWMGFVFLGALSFHFKQVIDYIKNILFSIGAILLVAAFILMFNQAGSVRDEYLELWYPAKGISLLIPFSVYFMLMGLITRDLFFKSLSSEWLKILGRNSLFVYVINAMIIVLVSFWDLIINEETFTINIAMMIALFLLIVYSTKLMDNSKKKQSWHSIPVIFKYLLGYN